ncbi:hypothetical protein V2J09_002356 [Rumex salicifolius]
MKITALLVLKINASNDEEDPVILANASDVSHFGYFQRSSVKEFIVFVSRTVAKRTPPGQRQSVQHSEYKVHAYNRGGLCALGFMDDHYPVRSAFSLLNKVLDEYQKKFGESWRTINTDNNAQPWPYLNEALSKYQDPAEADKLLKIQRELDETKIILHKTIDSVLERGERLDSLVEKSSDLSTASQGRRTPILPFLIFQFSHPSLRPPPNHPLLPAGAAPRSSPPCRCAENDARRAPPGLKTSTSSPSRRPPDSPSVHCKASSSSTPRRPPEEKTTRRDADEKGGGASYICTQLHRSKQPIVPSFSSMGGYTLKI